MKPILFNTEMVRAIRNGRKSVTRRVVKPQPSRECSHGGQHEFIRDDFIDGSSFTGFVCKKCGYGVCGPHFKYPVGSSWIRPSYGSGDILYVRETWRLFEGPFDEHEYYYLADETGKKPFTWHPSIHMPKEAARLFLRVTDVRVERLQDISDKDILSEGTPDSGSPKANRGYFADDIWDSTIQKKDLPLYGWAADPWVWVIEFERISKEEATKGGGEG